MSYYVSTPSGACPYKLNLNPTEEEIQGWAEKVKATGYKKYPYRKFTSDALMYWLKNSVWKKKEIEDGEFDRVKTIIDSCNPISPDLIKKQESSQEIEEHAEEHAEEQEQHAEEQQPKEQRKMPVLPTAPPKPKKKKAKKKVAKAVKKISSPVPKMPKAK